MSERANFGTVQQPLDGNHERSLRNILREIGNELAEFLETRVQMAKAELQETLSAVKVAVPLAILAASLFVIGILLLTLAVVSIIASAFAGSPYAWLYAFLIVGFCWIAFGSVAGFFALSQFKAKGRFPKRTIQVLKADKVWLQSEARGGL